MENPLFSQASMSAAAAVSRKPCRLNHRITRWRTRSVRAARSAWAIGRAGRNAGSASRAGTKTPSVTHAWRCTWRLKAQPKRCRKETAGGQYDQISLTGSLTYGGVMQLDLSQTFADNTSFNLFTGFTAGSGDFSSITSVGSAYNGLSFTRIGNLWTSGTAAGGQSLEFNQTTGTLVIVPEPAAFALAGLGIAVAAWARRRRS